MDINSKQIQRQKHTFGVENLTNNIAFPYTIPSIIDKFTGGNTYTRTHS